MAAFFLRGYLDLTQLFFRGECDECFPHWETKKETREKYLARLRRTALRLPPKFINSSIKNMRERCQRLHKAKGGHIEVRGGGRNRKRS